MLLYWALGFASGFTSGFSIGNRTNYANNATRNGSTTADTSYESVASGTVNILSLPYHVPPQEFLNIQTNWSTRNNLNLQYPLAFDLQAPSSGWNSFQTTQGLDDYYAMISKDCSTLSNSTSGTIHTGITDLFWMDANSISYFEDCLVDLYAWDTTIGQGTDEYTWLNGVVNSKLLGVGVEVQTSFLLYNVRYLTNHNYDLAPSTLPEMNAMILSILENERAIENYKLSGFTAPFTGDQDLINLLAEWAVSGAASIMTLTGDVGLLDGQLSSVLNLITGWVDAGIIDVDDIYNFDENAAFERWVNQESIFLRATPDMLKWAEDRAQFDWKTAVFPPLSTDLLTYRGPGSLSGWYLGVYKYAPNIKGAIKTAKQLTSVEYQRRLFVRTDVAGSAIVTDIVPIYPSILNARSHCQSIGKDICNTYVDTQTALCPGSQSKKSYHGVNSIVKTEMGNLLKGLSNINTALLNMDTQIRDLLHLPARKNTTDQGSDGGVTKPTSKYRALGPQTIVLCAIMAGFVGSAYLNKFRQMRTTSKETPIDIPLQDVQKTVDVKLEVKPDKISIMPFQKTGYDRLVDQDEIIELNDTSSSRK